MPSSTLVDIVGYQLASVSTYSRTTDEGVGRACFMATLSQNNNGKGDMEVPNQEEEY